MTCGCDQGTNFPLIQIIQFRRQAKQLVRSLYTENRFEKSGDGHQCLNIISPTKRLLSSRPLILASNSTVAASASVRSSDAGMLHFPGRGPCEKRVERQRPSQAAPLGHHRWRTRFKV